MTSPAISSTSFTMPRDFVARAGEIDALMVQLKVEGLFLVWIAACNGGQEATSSLVLTISLIGTTSLRNTAFVPAFAIFAAAWAWVPVDNGQHAH